MSARFRGVALCATLLLAGCLTAAPPTPTRPPAPPPATAPPRVVNDPTPDPMPPASPPTPLDPYPPVPDGATLAQANDWFALRLLAEAGKQSPRQNVFLSPLSASITASMALDGARGMTQVVLRHALGYDGMSSDQVNAAYRETFGALAGEDANVTFALADSIWLDQRLAPHVEPAFSRDMQEDYNAEAFVMDFRDPATVDAVNDWAGRSTHGAIPRVLGSIGADEAMLLLNAAYFQGDWADAFDGSCTHDADFTLENGSGERVPMMCGMDPSGLTYEKAEGFTLVRVPYRGGHVAMYAVLPAPGVPVGSLLASWDGTRFEDAVAHAKGSGVVLAMPRFNLSTKTDLAPPLDAMGAGIIFSDAADFSGIAPGLKVGSAAQQAVLRVNETGTVAAAVTGIGMVPTSVDPAPPPLVVRLDRPFALFVRDDETGALLFEGAVLDPDAG